MNSEFANWTTGGDPAQQRRRALMVDTYSRPEYWMNLAETGIVYAMRRTGNAPDRELANVVGFLVKAIECGLNPDELFLTEKMAPRIDAEPPELAEVWRAVVIALETLAMGRVLAAKETTSPVQVTG